MNQKTNKMKKRAFLLFIFLIIGLNGFSQTKAISYQAVILNPQQQELPGSNIQTNVLMHRYVSIQFVIEGPAGDIQYEEVHNTKTDRFGMINLLIGKGQKVSVNTFDEISWDGTGKMLKVGIDFSGGSNFEPLGQQELTFYPQPPSEEVRAQIDQLEETVSKNSKKVGLSDAHINTLEIVSGITTQTLQEINDNNEKINEIESKVSDLEDDIGNVSFNELNAATKAYIDQLLIKVADPAKLIAAGFSFAAVTGGKTVAQLYADGISVADLIQSGATATELINAGAPVSEMFNGGLSYTELVTGGVSVSDLQSIGASTSDLVAANASISEMIAAGISVGDLLNENVTVSQLVSGNAPISDLLSAGVNVGELVSANASLADMLAANISIQDLLNENVTVNALVSSGASVSDLIAASVTTAQLVSAGASTSDMLAESSISVQDLLDADETVLNLLNASVTASSLIGKLYQGGIITYVNNSDGTGLIAALSDASGSVIDWANPASQVMGTSAAIGAGADNTTKIITALGTGISAAAQANAYTSGGYNDWFLPSPDEIKTLWDNLATLNSTTGFTDIKYFTWTSHNNNGGTYAQRLKKPDGTIAGAGQTGNNGNNYVRPMRYF
jgi:hypothetical protein